MMAGRQPARLVACKGVSVNRCCNHVLEPDLRNRGLDLRLLRHTSAMPCVDTEIISKRWSPCQHASFISTMAGLHADRHACISVIIINRSRGWVSQPRTVVESHANLNT